MDPRIKRLKQAGLTLVELMIALSLSLLMMALVFTSVLADGAAYEATRSSNQLVHQSRMNLHLLRLYLQQAGYREFEQILNNVIPEPVTAVQQIGGFAWTWDHGQVLQGLNNQSASHTQASSDVIAIRYYGSDVDNGEVYRCDGERLLSGELNTLVVYVTNGNQLMCADSFATAGVVLEVGVEQLQVEYAPNLDGQYRYLNAAEVGSGVDNWSQIGHLRLVLLQSQDMARAPAAVSQSYQLLDTSVTVAGETSGKARQVVRDNISLPNNRGV